MAWISKKKLNERITELERKVNELDPQKIAEKAIRNLEELPKDIQEQIRGIVRSETENFNDRLEKNKTEIEAQKEKLNNLRSRIKENGQKVVNGISDVLKEVFGPSFKEIPIDKGETAAEPKQQAAEKEIPDGT